MYSEENAKPEWAKEMILLNALTGEIFSARLTYESAASYGQPAIVREDNGEMIDLVGMEILSASRETLDRLGFSKEEWL